jgi:hypothetical protein
MRSIAVFATATVFGGLGGLIGSVLGSGLGKDELFIGGYLGGVLMAPVTGFVTKARGWIPRSGYWPVTAGAALGFLAAATLAVNTLSSPIGPLIATTLTGLGALAGARFGAR